MRLTVGDQVTETTGSTDEDAAVIGMGSNVAVDVDLSKGGDDPSAPWNEHLGLDRDLARELRCRRDDKALDVTTLARDRVPELRVERRDQEGRRLAGDGLGLQDGEGGAVSGPSGDRIMLEPRPT
jgi:hypothetical protein